MPSLPAAPEQSDAASKSVRLCGRPSLEKPMSRIHDDVNEMGAHEQAIDALIAETRLPADAVRSAYEREYSRLSLDARIKNYLVLFTVRRAKEALRR
jgi:hypothetical protein